MRQLGKLTNSNHAAAFSDYLVAQGILAEAKRSGDQWAVWVRDEDHFEQAKSAWEQFLRDPDDARYYEAATTAAQVRQEREAKRQQAQENTIDARNLWERPAIQRQPLTLALIVVSVVVSIWSHFGAKDDVTMTYFTPIPQVALYNPNQKEVPLGQGRDIFDDVKAGQVWRLVTPIFIHFGIIHLLFNMIWLYQFGCLVEGRRGSLFLAVLVLASAVMSNVGESWISSEPFRPALVGGFSGVVYALFGYIWIKGQLDRDWSGLIDSTIVLIMLGWLGLGLSGLGDFFLPNVGHWAHAIGLVAGMAFAYLPYLFVRRQ